MLAVLSLAWARLRHRPARWLLVCLGVAAATVLPLAAQGTATVVAAQALRHGLEAVPPGDRSLAAIRSALRESPQHLDRLDAAARRSLADLSSGPVRAQMLTRAISDGAGGSYYFGGADDLADRVRLIGGRLPGECTPLRCEVVAIGTGVAHPPAEVGIVVVGQAVRTDPLLFAGSFDPGDGAPLYIGDGIAATAQLEYLSAFQRSYAWISPVDLNRVDQLGVDGYLARSTRASIELYASRLSLTAPDEVLRAEADRAQRSVRRFSLLAGAATVLLLGFAVIGAIGLRRDHLATVNLLRRRGAGRGNLIALALITAAVPVSAGAVLGLGLGAVLSAWQAGQVGLPAWPAVGHAVRVAAATVALAAAAATVVVAVTLGVAGGAGADGAARGRAVVWRAMDLVVVAGIVVAALAIGRGAVSAAALDQGPDPLVFALPVIVVVCGALLVGRVWPVVCAAVAAVLPRRWLAARLGLVGAVRSPLRPVATAAFVAAATGIVAFAGAYQATLRQSAADQATFAVPLDASVRTGQSLRSPLEVASGQRFQAAGAAVYPVVRTAATVP
ncbi:MAG TPA: hypothetical protein VF163_14680, partial [Micromonosporaceae bacterium]